MIKLTEVKADGETFDESPFMVDEKRIVLFQEIDLTPEISVIGEESAQSQKFTLLIIESVSRPINVKESADEILTLLKGNTDTGNPAVI